MTNDLYTVDDEGLAVLTVHVASPNSLSAYEVRYAALIGTTDSTHFYWDGNDLAGFTEVDVTGTTTWVEDDNLGLLARHDLVEPRQVVFQTDHRGSCRVDEEHVLVYPALHVEAHRTHVASDLRARLLEREVHGLVPVAAGRINEMRR